MCMIKNILIPTSTWLLSVDILMKAAMWAESYNISSFFIVIHELQRCLLTVARQVSLSFFLINIFFNLNFSDKTHTHTHTYIYIYIYIYINWDHRFRTQSSKNFYLNSTGQKLILQAGQKFLFHQRLKQRCFPQYEFEIS